EKLQTEKEDKIEVLFPNYLESKILKSLFEVHPYEEVAYEIISLDNSHQSVGSGMIGNLLTPKPVMDFLNDLKNQMNVSVIRYTNPHVEKISKVAVCGGAGSFLL